MNETIGASSTKQKQKPRILKPLYWYTTKFWFRKKINLIN